MRSDYHALPASSLSDAVSDKLNLATIIAAMSHPCFELDSGEAATMLLAFAQARQQGYKADTFTVALVEVLARQLRETDDGFEDDIDVADFEDDRVSDGGGDDDECEDGEFSSLEPETFRNLMKTRAE